jgi:hypothetical protein
LSCKFSFYQQLCIQQRRLDSIQAGYEAHPASYPMGTGGSFPGGKAAGASSWPLTSI